MTSLSHGSTPPSRKSRLFGDCVLYITGTGVVMHSLCIEQAMRNVVWLQQFSHPVQHNNIAICRAAGRSRQNVPCRRPYHAPCIDRHYKNLDDTVHFIATQGNYDHSVCGIMWFRWTFQPSWKP